MTNLTLSLIAVLLASPALAGGGVKTAARSVGRSIPPLLLPIVNYFIDSHERFKGVIAELPASRAVREKIRWDGERMLESGKLLAMPWSQGQFLLASKSPNGPGAIYSLKTGKGFRGTAREAVWRMADALRDRESVVVSREVEAGYSLMRKLYDGPEKYGDDNVRWEKALVTEQGVVIAARDRRDDSPRSVLRTLDWGSHAFARVQVPNQYQAVEIYDAPLGDGRVLLKLKAARPHGTARLAAVDPATAEIRIFRYDASKINFAQALFSPNGRALAQLYRGGKASRPRAVRLVFTEIETGERRTVVLKRNFHEVLLQGFTDPDSRGRVFAMIYESNPRGGGKRWLADIRTGEVRAK